MPTASAPASASSPAAVPNAAFFSELLAAKPLLLRRIIAFNLDAEARAAPALDPLSAAAARDPQIGRALRSLCLKTTAGRPPTQGFWDFIEEPRRLALFDAASLDRLGKLAAAAAFGEEIALAIDRPHREALRTVLGADVCAYAVVRGRWQAGSLAEALRALAPAGTLDVRAAALARIVLEAAACRWPEALAELAKPTLAALSLPATPLPAAAAEGDMPLRIWRFLKKLILREMDPIWTTFFD